jgi:hypothetical protein
MNIYRHLILIPAVPVAQIPVREDIPEYLYHIEWMDAKENHWSSSIISSIKEVHH